MIFDVVAMVIGILWSIRKMEIRRSYRPPELSEEVFLAWQKRALSAYSLGVTACFGKILLDNGFQYFAARMQLHWGAVRIVGISLFALWLLGVFASIYLARRARLDGAALGVDSRGGDPDLPPA